MCDEELLVKLDCTEGWLLNVELVAMVCRICSDAICVVCHNLDKG